MTKKKTYQPPQKRTNYVLLFVALIFLITSCKKELTNNEISSFTASDFLRHSSHDSSLEKVIVDVQQQLKHKDFTNDFINWNGLPLWDNFEIVAKNNDNDFVLSIPTIKQNQIEAFFWVKHYNGKFFYELHNRNYITDNQDESSSIFALSNWKSEYILAHFEIKALGKQKAFLRFLEPKKLKKIYEHFGKTALPNQVSNHGKNIAYLRAKTVTSTGSSSNLADVDCCVTDCWDEQGHTVACDGTEVIVFDDCTGYCGDEGGGGNGGGTTGGDPTGGGGGTPTGGGGGCPWYNPNCGAPTTPPPLTPCQVVDSLMKMNNYPQVQSLLKTAATTDNYETAYLMTNPLNDNNFTYDTAHGQANNLSVDFNPSSPIDAISHNHYNDPKRLPIFSFHDIRKVYELIITNKIKNAKTFTFSMATNESAYILMLDSAKFKTFGDTFLSDSIIAITSEHLFYDIYKINKDNSIAVNEKHFLQWVRNSDCGIKIFRGNATATQYTPIRMDATGTTVENAPNCNFDASE